MRDDDWYMLGEFEKLWRKLFFAIIVVETLYMEVSHLLTPVLIRLMECKADYVGYHSCKDICQFADNLTSIRNSAYQTLDYIW